MAIRIPEQDRKVSFNIGSVSNPQSPNTGGIVSAIKENNQANQEIAKSVTGISSLLAKHAEEKRQIENSKIVTDTYTKFNRDLQDSLYSTDTEKVNIDGIDVDRPKGKLARAGSLANNITVEFDDEYNKKRSQYLSSVKDPEYQNKLATLMDKDYEQSRNKLISYEAKEWRNDKIKSEQGFLSQIKSNSYSIATPESLSLEVEKAIGASDNISKINGTDPNKSITDKQKNIFDVVTNSVLGSLNNTRDEKVASMLLESQKNNLSPDNYNKISEKIKRGTAIIKEQTRKAAVQQKVSNRIDIASKIANGTIRWDNSSELIDSLSTSDPDLAEAIDKVVSSDGSFEPKESDASFANITNKIFSSKDKEEVSKFLVEAMNSTGNGKISRDRLAIIVDAAMESGKRADIDSGYKAVYEWFNKTGRKNVNVITHYMMDIKEGKDPKEAVNNSILKAQVELNPNRIKYTVGDIVNTPNGGLKITGYDDDGEPVGEYIK